MALGPGSIAFVGINTSSTDWFAFVALEAIPANQVIYFTDNELPAANSATFNTGESYAKWTAPTGGIAAGTVVNFSALAAAVPGSLTVNVGTASMFTVAGSTNPGLSNDQDSLYAYLATSDATADTPTAFLSFINIGNLPDPVPASLSAGQYIVFNTTNDSAYFSGQHSGQHSFADYLSLINDTANWTQNAGATANNVPDFSNFSIDNTPPVVNSTTPSDDALNVSLADNIVLEFSETVQKGTGDILIRDTADNSVVQTIDVTSGSVAVAGAVVTIDPPADLAPNHAYYVEVPAGAIKDLANNDFAGISGSTAFAHVFTGRREAS